MHTVFVGVAPVTGKVRVVSSDDGTYHTRIDIDRTADSYGKIRAPIR